MYEGILKQIFEWFPYLSEMDMMGGFLLLHLGFSLMGLGMGFLIFIFLINKMKGH